MATAGQDGLLRIWKPDEGNSPFLSIEAHDGAIYGVSFSRSGHLIATAGSDRAVNVWNPKDGSLVAGPLEHDRSVRAVAFGLDDDLLVSVSSDGSTRIWNPTMGYVVEQPFARRSRPLLCAAVSTDRRLVAVGGADGVVELWDSTGERPPTRLAGHSDQVKAVAFNPIDGTLASSGTDRTTLLWDTHSGELSGEALHGYDGTVYSLAFSPDGAILASGSYDGTVRAATMPGMAPTDEPIVETSSAARSVAFSPDGMAFAVATADGSILLCSSTRAEIPGAELDDVLTGLEHLVDATRPGTEPT
jgi:WD40 repeat protein